MLVGSFPCVRAILSVIFAYDSGSYPAMLGSWGRSLPAVVVGVAALSLLAKAFMACSFSSVLRLSIRRLKDTKLSTAII